VRCGGIIEVVLCRMKEARREKSRFYAFRLILIVGHCRRLAKSKNLQDWHYTPLMLASYIWIFDLLPTKNPSDPLECWFIETNLENTSKYNAI
jgi:hypothetical protein